MAIKTWSPGEDVYASDLNGEFNNVYENIRLTKEQEINAGEDLSAFDLVKLASNSGVEVRKIVGEYIDVADTTPSLATPANFALGNPYYRDSALLTALLAVHIYVKDSTTVGFRTVSIASNGGLTNNAEATIIVAGMGGEPFIIERLSDTSFIATYNNAMVVGTVSGTTITLGTPVDVGQRPLAVSVLDSDTFALAYKNGYDLYAAIGSVSGTTPSLGSASIVVDGTAADYPYDARILLLSAASLVVSYGSGGGRYSGLRLKAATVSGTTISSWGSEITTLDDYDGAYQQIIPLSDTKAFIHAFDSSTTAYAAILSVSGTTLSCSTPYSVSSSGGVTGKLAMMYSGDTYMGAKILSTYIQSGYVYAKIFTINTGMTDISAVATTGAFATGADKSLDAFMLSRSRVFVTYYESNNMCAVVGTFDTIDDRDEFVGINREDTDSGNDAIIHTAHGTLVTGMTGLTEGEKYYIQEDGTLGTTSSAYVVGIALSTTSLLFY